MIRYLTLAEVLDLHRRVLETSGGGAGLRDQGGLASAVAQPQMTFGGEELYPTLADKAAALGFSLILNHPFVDGNKRVGHAALETFLVLNGYELDAEMADQEQTFLAVAAGTLDRAAFAAWIKEHVRARPE
jgi:death-on-curing protein